MFTHLNQILETRLGLPASIGQATTRIQVMTRGYNVLNQSEAQYRKRSAHRPLGRPMAVAHVSFATFGKCKKTARSCHPDQRVKPKGLEL